MSVVKNQPAAAILLALACLILLVLVVQTWNFTADDAFIIYRYADNVVAGYGANYNPGERAEGYTTPLWLVIAILPHLLRVDPVIFGRIAGLACTLGAGYTTFHLTIYLLRDQPETDRTLIASLSMLLLFAYPPTALHGVSGLGTSLFALTLTGFAYLLARFVSGDMDAWTVALAALLMGLSRPEGNLVAAVALIAAGVLTAPARRIELLRAVALAYVLPGLIYFTGRWAYYGHLLPLPFYVKVSSQRLMAGTGPVWGFLQNMILRLGLLLVFSPVWRYRALIPALAGGASLIAFYLFPAHLFGYWHRYLYPLVPLLCVLAALGARVLLGWARGRGSLPLEGAAMVGVLVVVAGLFLDAPRVIGYARSYGGNVARAFIPLGRLLAACQTAGDQLLVMGEVGAMPYYSGWRVIDLVGLNDPHLAFAAAPDPDYVLSRQPDLFIFASASEIEWIPRVKSYTVYYDAALAAGMERVNVIRVGDSYYFWLVARPDHPVVACLEASL